MTDTPPTPRDRMHAADELRRTVRTGDPLAESERDILGHSAVRLHIELRDTVYLKTVVVPVLRHLANSLEVAADIRGPQLNALSAARGQIVEAKYKLKRNPSRNCAIKTLGYKSTRSTTY